ncbi:MAG: MFS transporter [Syntrophorhabdaceae bacterium]|nr:MFS transporter [Syntrophorhabdaceae bacterium]
MLFLLFIWFLWFMSFTSRAIFSPIMPLIEDDFGIAHARATSVFTFISIGYGVSLFFSGTFANIFGYRKAIILSNLISGTVYFLIPNIPAFKFIYPLAIILGMSSGLYLPSIMPLITDYYEKKLWGKAIALHGSGPSVGIFAAPFIALFVLQFFSWKGVFFLLGTVMFVCAGIFSSITDEVRMEKKKGYFLFHILKSKTFWIIGTMWIFSAGCNLGLYLVIPLYLVKELLMDIEEANAIFGMSRIGGAILTVSAGFFVDRISIKKASFLLMASTGIFTLLLTVTNLNFIKVILFFQATVSPTIFTFAMVMIPRLFKEEERGQATGFIVTLTMIGTGVIPYLLGLSGDYLSFRFGIALLGILTIVSSGLVGLLKDIER